MERSKFLSNCGFGQTGTALRRVNHEFEYDSLRHQERVILEPESTLVGLGESSRQHSAENMRCSTLRRFGRAESIEFAEHSMTKRTPSA